jgi:hypothetical protein
MPGRVEMGAGVNHHAFICQPALSVRTVWRISMCI